VTLARVIGTVVSTVKHPKYKGLKLLLVFYFALPSIVYVSLLINGYLFLIVLGIVLVFGIIVWAYNVWDAWNHEPIV